MRGRIVLLGLLALALAGCGALPDARYGAALRRWQARPLGHYLLRTYEEVGGQRCGQMVEVRGEQVIQILSNTCRHPTLWTVTWLFNRAGRGRPAYEACAKLAPGAGCVCRNTTELQATFDPALGYPSEIVERQSWRADWQSMDYWRYAIGNGALPNCTPPFNDPGNRVVVREIRPLP